MPRLNRDAPAKPVTWEQHAFRWSSCQACELSCQRTRVVLARGDVPCDLLVVGEAPGQSEDVLGRPFCGPAGHLLDQVIEAALGGPSHGFRIAYTNVVACFPAEAKKTDDHRPSKAHIKACAPRLAEFVQICSPRLTVCLGDTAKQWLHLSVDETDERWSIIRIPHPAAILHANPVQRPQMIKKCVVAIANAVEKLG